MSDTFLIFSGVFLLSVFVSSCSQVMLKTSARKEYPNRLREYLNPLVVIAYVFFFGSTLVGVLAYRQVPLSWGPIFESAGYFFVGILSFLILKERLKPRALLGMALIIVGILICSIPGPSVFG